jgi:hypothetical protein
MILESDGIASRIFGSDRTEIPLKLDSGHGFDLSSATQTPPIPKLPLRLKHTEISGINRFQGKGI